APPETGRSECRTGYRRGLGARRSWERDSVTSKGKVGLRRRSPDSFRSRFHTAHLGRIIRSTRNTLCPTNLHPLQQHRRRADRYGDDLAGLTAVATRRVELEVV